MRRSRQRSCSPAPTGCWHALKATGGAVIGAERFELAIDLHNLAVEVVDHASAASTPPRHGSGKSRRSSRSSSARAATTSPGDNDLVHLVRPKPWQPSPSRVPSRARRGWHGYARVRRGRSSATRTGQAGCRPTPTSFGEVVTLRGRASRQRERVSTSEQKVVQYLDEARASELALALTLRAHIAITPRGEYRSRLDRHLGETNDHARRCLLYTSPSPRDRS